MNSSFLARYKIPILSLLAFAIGYALWISYLKLPNEELHFDWRYLLVSLVFHILGYLSHAWIWHRISLITSCSLPMRESFKIWIYSEMGKYIPGKIFGIAGRVYLYSLQNRSKKVVLASSYLEIICGVIGYTWMSLLLLALSGHPFPSAVRTLVSFSLPSLFLISHPKVISMSANIILKRLKRTPLEISIGYLEVLKISALYALSAPLIAIGFVFLVQSLAPLDSSNYIYVAGVYLFAGVAGNLSFFAPSGVGVREGVIVLLLKNALPLHIGAATAILARLICTLAELILLGAASLSSFRSRNSKIDTKTE